MASHDPDSNHSFESSQELIQVLREIRDELRVQHQWHVEQTERSWKHLEEKGNSCGTPSLDVRMIVASVIAFLGGLGLGLLLN